MLYGWVATCLATTLLIQKKGEIDSSGQLLIYHRCLVISLILYYFLYKCIIFKNNVRSKKTITPDEKLECRYPLIICIGRDDYDHSIYPIGMNNFFSFFLRYNCHTALYKFKVYHIMT